MNNVLNRDELINEFYESIRDTLYDDDPIKNDIYFKLHDLCDFIVDTISEDMIFKHSDSDSTLLGRSFDPQKWFYFSKRISDIFCSIDNNDRSVDYTQGVIKLTDAIFEHLSSNQITYEVIV